jgi:hypothetical protein
MTTESDDLVTILSDLLQKQVSDLTAQTANKLAQYSRTTMLSSGRQRCTTCWYRFVAKRPSYWGAEWNPPGSRHRPNDALSGRRGRVPLCGGARRINMQFTPHELERALGINETELLKLVATGTLPFTVTVDGLRVESRDLPAWRSAVRKEFRLQTCCARRCRLISRSFGY